MYIKNRRFFALGITTAISSAVVAGVVLSVIYVGKFKRGLVKKTKNNTNITFNKIQDHQDLALQSIKSLPNKDFHDLYSNEDKLKAASNEANNKTHEVIQLIKSNIKGKHHVEAKKLIRPNIVALKPTEGVMTIELNLSLIKHGVSKRSIDIDGFKTNEEKINQDVDLLTNHFLNMGLVTENVVSFNSSLPNASTIKPNSFLKHKNKETPNAPAIFGFKAPTNIPEGLEVKYVPHTFSLGHTLTNQLEGVVVISAKIMHSSDILKYFDL